MWQTESGLKDNYNVEIKAARFANSPKYKDGEVYFLEWEVEDGVGNSWRESFPCGSGWSAVQSGRAVVNASGPDKLFNKNTFMGRLIDRCIKDLDLGSVFEKHGFDDPRKADGWVGFKFQMTREKITFGKDKEGKIIEVERPMPSKFLGVARKVTVEDLMATLSEMAKKLDAAQFESEALKIAEVKSNNDLVVKIISGDMWREFNGA